MGSENSIDGVIIPDRIANATKGLATNEGDAYRIYLTTGARSLRRTADLLGIPHGTILSWSQRHNWRQRMIDTDLEVTEGIADAAAVAIVRQQLDNVAYLSRLRDDDEADHKDRIRATTTLMKEFKDVSAAVANRVRDDVAPMDEAELEELAATPEGVAVLLARQRARAIG